MDKQEFIHIHSLLLEVRNEIEEREGGLEEIDEIEEYDNMDISPESIHKNKSQHKSAIFKLSEGLAKATDDKETEERIESMADGLE